MIILEVKKMANTRRHDLDWLRVLAFFLLIIFHSGMPFIEYPWHIKNTETSVALGHVWGFLHSFRMPLLFLISGAGIWFAIGSRGGAGFLKERSIRLLLPLTFGILVIVPPQIYLERLTQGVEFSSYLDFYPHFFEGYYFSKEGGNFSPHHLWFIGSLFIYCLLLLPLLLFIKSKNGSVLLNKIDQIMSHPVGLYLPIIPFSLAVIFVGGDMLLNAKSPLLMLLGFVMVSRKNLWSTIEKQRFISLAGMFCVIGAINFMAWSPEIVFSHWQFKLAEVSGLIFTIFAILGFARHHLSFSSRFIKYCNEGVYPFYILHQTITVILVYHLVPLELNLWIKFGLTTFGTALFTLAIYHYGIRPFNFIRPLFGLKKIKRESIEVQAVTA